MSSTEEFKDRKVKLHSPLLDRGGAMVPWPTRFATEIAKLDGKEMLLSEAAQAIQNVIDKELKVEIKDNIPFWQDQIEENRQRWFAVTANSGGYKHMWCVLKFSELA